MYLDYVLFVVSGILLLTALGVAIWLLCSKEKTRTYRRILQDTTEQVDVVDTMKKTFPLHTQPLTAALPNEESVQSMQTELLSESTTPLSKKTVKLPEGEHTQQLVTQLLATQPLENTKVSIEIGEGLDITPLEGKYELIKEIYGGGMSRIFLARQTKLGNEWIVKFIDTRVAGLAHESDILKSLNHISLPQVIDIFETRQGVFIVERYIEGYSLKQVFESGQQISKNMTLEWALQLARVLDYLHSLDTPIVHCDLKPANIMVTHNNQLALIDFGISRRKGIDEEAVGITFQYAAPEQFSGIPENHEAVITRFGTLPPEHSGWGIDARTDLYSVGVILYELITGETPQAGAVQDISQYAGSKLAEVVMKCLEVDPDKRYQSAKELVMALEGVRTQQFSMVRSLFFRKVATACCMISLTGGLTTTASASYVNYMENLSVVAMDPGYAIVTEQQGAQIFIQKTNSKGEVTIIEPSQITWSYSEDNIARISGDRLIGVNVGETTLYGKYRNKLISLDITVTEPIEEAVAISLRYDEDAEVTTYAGNGERDFVDGTAETGSFTSPESLSADDDTLYVSDSGVIRALENGIISTTLLEPSYLTADKVRGYDDAMYVLTGPWESDGATYYGFIRISDGAAELLYYTDAVWSTITDFNFSSDGTLWFIQQNLGTGMTTLNTLDIETLESAWIMDLPDSSRGMAFDENETLYISVPDSGVILRVGKEESNWTYFAGVEGERHFIDGEISNFYRPTSLAAEGNVLYVLDFDTIRMITIEGGVALFTETLVGIPTADTNPEVKMGSGNEAILPASELASIALDGEGRLLLSDPKNSVIYQIVH